MENMLNCQANQSQWRHLCFFGRTSLLDNLYGCHQKRSVLKLTYFIFHEVDRWRFSPGLELWSVEVRFNYLPDYGEEKEGVMFFRIYLSFYLLRNIRITNLKNIYLCFTNTQVGCAIKRFLDPEPLFIKFRMVPGHFLE